MLHVVTDANGRKQVFIRVSRLLEDAYSPLGQVEIVVREISLADVRWGTAILSHSRVQKSQELVELLVRNRIPLFPFGFSELSEGETHLLVPPIVESYLDSSGHKRWLLMDGSHRVYAAALLESFCAIAISFSSPAPELPCRPLTRDELQVQSEQPRLKSLFMDMREKVFRPVRKLVHHELRFENLSHAINSTCLKNLPKTIK
jgi:hypothetical protein